MKFVKNLLSIFILLLLLILLSCQSREKFPITVRTITDHIKVFEALTVRTTVVSSEQGLVIIDTQRSPGIMAAVLEEIEKEFGKRNVIRVINTHGHWDHCSGNQLFADSIIIGHRNCPEYMRRFPANALTNMWSVQNHVQSLQTKLDTLHAGSDKYDHDHLLLAARRQVLEDLQNGYYPNPPAITFDDRMDIRLGDLTLQLIYAGNAHTNNDILIYIPQEKVLVSGDLFISADYYGFDINQMSDIERLLIVLDTMIHSESGVQKIITSHDEILSGQDLKLIRSAIDERYAKFRDRTSGAVVLMMLMRDYGPSEAVQLYAHRIQEMKPAPYQMEKEFITLGRRYLGLGQIENAIAVLELTSQIYPQSALAYDNLGEAFLLAGKKEQAIAYYEESLELEPFNRNASEVLKLIR